MVNVYLFHDLLSVPILHHYHPDSRSKVNVTRPTNAHTVNVLYLPNRKAWPTNFKIGTQTEHEDPQAQ